MFTQLIKLLPKESFDWIAKNYDGDKYIKYFTCWNQLLDMMFGQLYGCERLRELVSMISAHSKKGYHLEFGKEEIYSRMAFNHVILRFLKKKIYK